MVAGGSGAVSGAIAQDERVVVYALLVRWAAPQTAVDGCTLQDTGEKLEAGRANLGVAPAASGPALIR